MISVSCLVALPPPVAQPYRYSIPPGIADRVVPGVRVLVPVRGREVVGVVVAVDDGSATDLKPILAVPDAEPLVPDPLIELAGWMAGYYGASLGRVLKAMLPRALWGASRLVARLGESSVTPGGASRDVLLALERAGGRASASALARRVGRPVWDTLQRLARIGAVGLEIESASLGPPPAVQRVLVLTQALPGLLERQRMFGKAARQREAYDAVDALGGECPIAHLTQQLGFSGAILRALVARGVARIDEREELRDPFKEKVSRPPETPTEAQAAALAQIRGLGPGEAITLFGVTGSGKTLVYLEAVRDDVSRGRGAIVLVPEISLTPQTVARVRGVFGEQVAVMHSGLSDAERADAWKALATGQRRVAVGARSAVFAPVRDLAAVIVDEEHDASYKQSEAPRYHARDIALKRARLQGARAVLGSATPSLETWLARDRIRVVSLLHRVTQQPLPAVRMVDMRNEAAVAESGAVPWSCALDDALRDCLERGAQALLLLNRRGFAQFLQCPDCGSVAECPACSISLTVHTTPVSLRCHYCGHREAIPESCGQCGHRTQRTRGVGTQLLERWLAQRFPRARLARMDADTTSTKWSHGRILEAFAAREIDILFGTQMIAKGLDFPGVTLVGVVDADTSLHVPDFRSAERTFQLIAQVAGRAGRGPEGGEVLVQTRRPEHYALTAAADHDYERFAQRELENRREPPYPPHVGLVNVVISGRGESAVSRAAGDIAEWLRGLVRARAEGAIDVIGPAPAPLARIRTQWRWHVAFRAADKTWLGRVVRFALQNAPHVGGKHVRVTFDRDPTSLL